MKPLLFLAFLTVLLEVAYAFTFRPPAEHIETTERTKRRNPLQSLHQLKFWIASTTTIKTTTATSPAPLALTIVPSQITIATLNSPLNENNTRSLVFQNSSDSLQTRTNDTIIVDASDASFVVENANNNTCGQKSEIDTNGPYLSDDVIRSKLCSNVNSSSLWEYRFDLDAKVCSQVGKQSHCGKNMIFYSYAKNTIYGYCDCDYSSEIPLIYHPNTTRCYFMYQQGYCGTEEWLEMDKNGTSICTKNKCYNYERRKFGAAPLAALDKAPEVVPLQGEGPCVRLNEPNQKFCKNSTDIVAFRWPFSFYPNCGQPGTKLPEGLSGRFLGGVSPLDCKPGTYLNIMGACTLDWDFD